MTAQLVQEIGKLGMPAQPASLPTAAQGPTLATVGGQERLVEDFHTNARSSRKPGFGLMAGAGAAGAATGTTTGIGLGTDALLGSQDAESDTRQAAVAITKELARFFARQGWISTEQADHYQLIP